MRRIFGGPPRIEAMFDVLDGWTTQFLINDVAVGGDNSRLRDDERLHWQLRQIGGAAGGRALELGPLEGAHTKMLIEAGAREVIAVEGCSDCWLRCLIVKEAFQLTNARFLFGDFCSYVADYRGPHFDFVLAAGVLYHQQNPAKLIYDLAKITDRVLVWSHVADATRPSHIDREVQADGRTYRGKLNCYEESRGVAISYCGGMDASAIWLYPDDLRRCFMDAGFVRITESPSADQPNGASLLFVAAKV